MKKFLVFFLLLFSFVNVRAEKINQIIFFGDSLTDHGNVYQLLFHLLPKSPPYFNGRFSNGPTWAENVGKYYYDKNYADYKIYAFGGATAIYHPPIPKFVSLITLELEINKYLLDSIFVDKSKVLFSIWIGGNDYLFDTNVDAHLATDKVVNKIVWAIKTLQHYGAEKFLILNLPDLSRIPMVQGSDSINQLRTLSVLHNQKLDAAIQHIQTTYPKLNITSINIYDIFNDVIDYPSKYNQKYHIKISNTKEACWTGGYTLKNILSQQGLTKEIQQTLVAKNVSLPKNVDAAVMSHFIMNTPSLVYTYQMSKSYEFGNVPCPNVNEYLFWDSIHPTAVTHYVLSQIVIEALESQINKG